MVKNVNSILPLKLILLFVSVIALVMISITGSSQHNSLFGIESQLYPTGFIPGLRFDHKINSKDAITIRVGYQIIRHRDLGKHDDERGDGAGFSLGIKRAISSSFNIHLRNDFWWNNIAWKDDVNGMEVSGHTDIVVIQPTASLEYPISMGDHYVLIPSVAVGVEWNVKTDGDPTGEGLIGLIGIYLAKQF